MTRRDLEDALDEKRRCSFNPPIWSRKVRCRQAAKVERDGKPWCGRHDPVATLARKTKAEAKRKASWDEESKRRARSQAIDRCEKEMACIGMRIAERLCADPVVSPQVAKWLDEYRGWQKKLAEAPQ